MESLDGLVRNYARHAEACHAAECAVPAIVPIMRTVFVSDSTARLTKVREALTAQLQTMRSQAAGEMRARMSESVDAWGIVGSPAQVRERVDDYRRELGMTHLIATRLRIGGIDSSELESSTQTLAEIVRAR